MKLVSSQQMRALDAAAIQRHGISSLTLMEAAGEGLARAALRLTPESAGPAVVICGPGNNGGDGLVAARLLAKQGRAVRCLLLASLEHCSADAKENARRLSEAGIAIEELVDERALLDRAPLLGSAGVIIDAIFGTGLTRAVEGINRKAIELINAAGVPVVAADIPSGLCADTGAVLGIAVNAAATCTFGLPKAGLVLGEGGAYAGRVEVIAIGIPADEIAAIQTDLEWIDPAMVAPLIPRRAAESHKGSFGHLVIFAGSTGHLGAGYLASLAALRAGCGLCTYALPAAAFETFDARYPEVMAEPIADGGAGFFTEEGLAAALALVAGKQAIAIGPAVGTQPGVADVVNRLLAACALPAVIDADGLNVLDLDRLSRRSAPAVLTPHPQEMSRLLRITTPEVQGDRIKAARTLARRSHAVAVLKGHNTVIADAGGFTAISPTGNPGMATAGMGDALTGIIASLLAQGLCARDAAIAGVYLHGLAGDIAAEEHGEASLIATDVITRLGKAIARVKGS